MAPGKTAVAWIKRSIFILALLPLARLLWLGFTDRLGANPVEFIEHSTGTWALVGLLLSLAVTPLRLLSGWGWLLSLRRMLGLFMFFYACLHFMAYLWLDHWFDWPEIAKDILKHPYVLVGFLALILSVPLAATSNDAMMRKLGKRWKTLHALNYPVAVLAVLHYLWLVKQDISQPVTYALILLGLLSIRIAYRLRNKFKLINNQSTR
ncbi:sulfoxide reductase heme-binding subunit YedZ [Methylobacillus flagellatus]|uniref:sulfite oxidase heme-binding subunit YedZ n=1 Tax=Methylobacillus flagellatus TaxID=405 RepID=UPI002853BBE4|nr:protein-methionine-sulfoxide reductase heme-binding subunit MsrQ [Methylobacillus flagellatus]MDR5171370.1 sulfoxide reductase heme-binding subunit YedZ [Methylobacillus flagellatus]